MVTPTAAKQSNCANPFLLFALSRRQLQTPQAKSLFPRYAEATAPRVEKARLMRGKEGWLTEQEMQLQLHSTP